MGWPRSPDERECEDIAENSITVNLDQTKSSYQVPDGKPVLVSILRKSRYSAQERDPVGPGLKDLDWFERFKSTNPNQPESES